MLNKRLKYKRRKERTQYKLKTVGSNKNILYFYRSNKYIYSQIIDGYNGNTITSLSTCCNEFKDLKIRNNIQAAELLGHKMALILIKKEIQNIYLNRGGLKYHGKVKAFADSVRKEGLKF